MTRTENPTKAQRPSSTEDVTFSYLWRLFNKKYLITKAPFWIALVAASMAKFISCKLPHDATFTAVTFAQNISTTIASISGSILGIVIAGLAIITALANGKLLNILERRKTLHRLLFPFWLVAVSWGITIGLSLLLYPLSVLLHGSEISWAIFVVVFFFAYSTSATVGLVGNTIQIGLVAARFNPELMKAQTERSATEFNNNEHD